RRQLEQWLPNPPVWLQQVHGTRVFHPDTCMMPDHEAPEADAAVTTEPDRVLAILTADCLPVVIGCPEVSVLGVAHAGWRGLAAGVLRDTVATLKRHGSIRPGHRLRAWIGPAISQPCFEVGNDVVQAFVSTNASYGSFFIPGARADKWLADLAGIAAC